MAKEMPRTANRRPKGPPRDDKGAPRGLPGEPEAAKIVDFYWLQRSFLAYLFILTFSNICLWSDRRACPFLNSCSHDLWVRTHTCSCDLGQGWGWLEPKRVRSARVVLVCVYIYVYMFIYVCMYVCVYVEDAYGESPPPRALLKTPMW